MPKKNTQQDFWDRVDKSDPNGCWPWTGGKWDNRRPNGYGKFSLHAKKDRAHRWAWRLANGPIPSGKHVLHSCDNPSCCNPAHLRVGDHHENMRDMTERKRYSTHTRADGIYKLSPQDAETIRREYRPGRASKGGNGVALAARFGVSYVWVWRLGTGRS